MKTRFLLILALILAFAVVACSKEGGGEDTAPETYTLTATVIEVYDSGLLVEPVEGSWELNSADRITVGTGRLDDEESLTYLTKGAAVGDTVEITYDGMLAETYPAQIANASAVRLVSRQSGE